MSDVNIIVRSADQTKKAEVSLPRESTGADIIQNAVENWSLPTDTDYQLTNISQNTIIQPENKLGEETVKDNDILEVQPVLVAGLL